MFMKSYRVQSASIDGSSGQLHVVSVDSKRSPGPFLAVQDDVDRKVVVRRARKGKVSKDRPHAEVVLIVDLPDFDLNSLVGELLVPSH
ncbi:MAG: hypothetical protein AAF629_07200 [Chloroflexota bacterium]